MLFDLKRAEFCTVFFLAGLVLIGCAENAPSAHRVEISRREIIKLPSGFLQGDPCQRGDEPRMTASHDMKRFAFIAGKRNDCAVVLDGVEGKHYAEIIWYGFSLDSQHFAYSAEDKGGADLTVEDGQETPATARQTLEFFGSPRYYAEFDEYAREGGSADGQHAFLIRDGPNLFGYNCYAEVDKVAQKQYSYIGFDAGHCPLREATFSPNGVHFAYISSEDGLLGMNRQSFVVLDGNEHKRYADVTSLEFTDDSQHLAYAIRDGDSRTGKWRVIVDGIEGPEFDELIAAQRFLDIDSDNKLRYIARQGNSILAIEEEIR